MNHTDPPEELLTHFHPLMLHLLTHPLHPHITSDCPISLTPDQKEELWLELQTEFLTRLPQYDPFHEVQLVGYLSSILRWKANNWTSALLKVLSHEHVTDDVRPVRLVPIGSVEHEQDDADMMVRWQPYLNQLSPRQKEVVTYHYFHGISMGETARIMNISRSNVFTHRKAALKKLQNVLKNTPLE